MAAILLNAVSVQGMEITHTNHEQQTSQAEIYNNTICLLTSLPNEKLIDIFAYCHAQDNDPVKALNKSIKSFIGLKAVCKNFNTSLTCETIGELCKWYAQIDKNNALQNIMGGMAFFDNHLYTKNRLPALILICAKADHEKLGCYFFYHVVTTRKDIELTKTLLDHKANPNKEGPTCCPIFFDATIEIAQLFINQGANVHTLDINKNNVLNRIVPYENHSSELINFYLSKRVNGRRLNPLDNSCLFHALASPIFTRVENIADFLKKGALLLDAIPDMINTLDHQERTPIDIAIISLEKVKKYGATSAFEQLIALFREHGGLTAQELTQSATILLKSIQQSQDISHIDTSSLLTAKNKDGETVLHLACEQGDVDSVGKICRIAGQDFEKLLFQGDKSGYLCIHKAAEKGHVLTIELLMRWCQRNNQNIYWNFTSHDKNGTGSTPLHCAAAGGHVKAASTILGWNSNPLQLVFKKKHGGHTSLHLAAANGHADMVKFLLETVGTSAQKLAAVDNRIGSTAIHSAIVHDHIEVIKAFVQVAIDNNWLNDLLNIRTQLGSTLLDYAKNLGKTEIIAYLQSLSNVECSLCLETKSINECHIMNGCTSVNNTLSGCKHSFCTECLLQHIATHLDEGSTHGLICPNVQCGKKMHQSDIQVITQHNKELYERFDKITFDEFVLHNNKKIKKCPTPDCECTYEVDDEPHHMKCPSCKKIYCSHCLVKHAQEMSCEQAREHAQRVGDKDKEKTANEEWLQQHTKACPQCNTLIEKNGGCYYMFCKKCGHKFCWKCLQPHDHTMNHPCGLWEDEEDMNQAEQDLIEELEQ